MRLRPGRPDLGRYADRFSVPAAQAEAPLSVMWLGVTTLLIDDGSCALLTDGYFSRPSLPRIALRKVSPSDARIDGCLAHAGARNVAAVVPLHTHIDHALDCAAVAERTGAVLVGGGSAARVGHALPAEQMVVAVPGEPITVGAYQLTLIESRHCPPDRMPGVISAPVTPPVRASAYKCGEAWSVLVHHQHSGRRLLILGSAGFVPGALTDQRADVVYLGIGQLGLQPRSYLLDYWAETVRAVGAKTVVLTHWDDFFRPLSKPLRAWRYAVDDLDVTMRVLAEAADADGVALHLPTLWRREDPWA